MCCSRKRSPDKIVRKRWAMIVYKYTTSSAIRAIVRNASLLARPVGDYNDSFEASPAASQDDLRRMADGVTRGPRGLRRYVGDHALNLEGLSEAAAKRRFEHDSSFHETVIDRIIERAKLSPDEVTKHFQNYWSRRLALVCLTKDPANFVMWSLYGEKHRGYVCAIDTDLWTPEQVNPKLAGGVSYSEHRVPVPDVQTVKVGDLVPIFMTKSSDWTKEQEYRILRIVKEDEWSMIEECGKKSRVDYLPLNPGQVKWICAGVYTPKEDVETLHGVLEQSKFPVMVYRASLDPTLFKVELPKECSRAG
jgi:hypothetical protein